MAETVEGPQLYGDPNKLGPGQYKALGTDPQSESIRMAVFGYNPATGKAFTPAESAAVSGGYVPEGYRDIVGYDFDPKTNQLTVLNKQGVASGLGARFQQTGAGTITPKLSSNWGAFRYDELGRPINAQGQPITNEDIRKYNELVGSNPAAAKEFAQGKGIAAPDGQPLTGDGTQGSNSSALVTSNAANQSKSNNNPFVPGSEAAKAWNERKSAYDLLYTQFNQYGLGALITPLQNLITEGVPASEFTIRLRETDAYKKRFSANAQRLAKGLAAVSEAEYLGLEDQYQNIMRNYGLPAEYYTRGDMGTQEGFTKFIANDVSAAELEDRIMTAQNRVINANPEVLASLKAFYPDITNGDILAYTLDPTKGLTDIKRKVTAAEIGGGAMQAGLGITGTRAGELTAAGITKQQAQQGFGTIAGGLERGSQLASIYGENPYTQTTAEQEVFGLAGKTEAEKQRKKLTGLEKATFGGQTGLSAGALVRDRAGAY
jgi:hypothetical protein